MRLDQNDSFLWTFEATVNAHATHGETPSVILDQSAFYPEGGGQLGDHGSLGEARVVDVQIAEGRVHHLVEGPLPAVGSKVQGRVDGARRLEHMTLHTAQHLLSRALDERGAATVSARLGESAATIDLQPVVSEATLSEAVQEVQSIIDEDRSVIVHYPKEAELAKFTLRRAPKVTEGIRLLEVEGYDVTPCGGTHCTRTAQIGLVFATGLRNHKGGSRVTFVAGPRARRYFRTRDAIVRHLCDHLATVPDELEASVAKVQRERDEVRETLGVTRAAWAELAMASLADATTVVRSFSGVDPATLRTLAAKLTEEGDRVLILAAPQPAGVHVIVARGPDATFNAGSFLRDLATAAGGRGGGRPNRAEGKLPAGSDVVELAEGLLRESAHSAS
ncbi:MAG: DHHA1 domain-containing protein [Myxococcota bacterium]